MVAGIFVVLTAWALTLLGLTAVAIGRSHRPPQGPTLQSALGEALAKLRAPVYLVRPCAGTEHHLMDNLVSAAAMGANQLSGVWHLVEEGDPAQPTVEAATEALRQRGVKARCILTHPKGANHKVAQLAEATSCGRAGDIWVCVDSDIDLSTFDAATMLRSLDGAHATWAPWCEGLVRPCSIADRLSEAVCNGSLHSFPLLCGLAPWAMVGKVMAVRFDALQAIGGWARFLNYLGEDFELGVKLRATGHRTTVAPVVARARATGRFMHRVVQRYVRWLLVVRGQRPVILVTYPLFFFHSLPLVLLCAMLAWGAAPWAPYAGALAFTGVACRFITACMARRRCGDPLTMGRVLRDVMLADMLLAYALVRALMSRRVAWRGRPLFVGPGGLLGTEESTTR